MASLSLGAGATACHPSGQAAPGATGLETKARQAGDAFLATYLGPDGRVSRTDQGGDTVSEGQAYAMLVAASLGDRKRFDLAWGWTQAHLQRPDGLLASHWSAGQVVDPQPATDADLDAARALLVAVDRFGSGPDRAAALRIGAAALALETVQVGSSRVLVAGPWAVKAPTMVDPSYFSPRTFAALANATGQTAAGKAGWQAVATSSATLLVTLTRSAPAPHLPPDWGEVDASGTIRPTGPPGQNVAAVYGYEAVRVMVRQAESCSAGDRSLAAAGWPFLQRSWAGGNGTIAATYHLDGSPQGGTHPVALVGAAGAASAAGDHAAAASLLDKAQALLSAGSSYYGSAWVALGRIMLTTDWLGTC